MRILLFGASGMVGASVLREALRSPSVSAITVVGRRPSGFVHPKLGEILQEDLFDTSVVELGGYDACIWAIGISSVGLHEPAYSRVTEELTLLWAKALLKENPDISFCYCSAGGAGGRSMWAKVRQRVEQSLEAMPFKHSGAVRPGFIRPGAGISSRTPAYQLGVRLLKPIFPFFPQLIRFFPFLFTTSEILGNAMLRIVEGKADRFILESRDINRLGA